MGGYGMACVCPGVVPSDVEWCSGICWVLHGPRWALKRRTEF